NRMDTGSPWMVVNNPRAPYWGTPSNPSILVHNCKLANLMRACIAVPHLSHPDGGVTPSNNPSLALFLMSILHQYNICWNTGPENLSIVSIGAGTYRPRLAPEFCVST